jgi:hypothetical protein
VQCSQPLARFLPPPSVVLRRSRPARATGETVGGVAQRSPSATVTKTAGHGRPSPAYCRGHGLMADRCEVDRRCVGMPSRPRACARSPLASRRFATALATRERNFSSNEHRDPGHAPCSMRGVSTPSAPACASRSYVYERRRPESTTLHRVVRENLATLYAAVEQDFASPTPSFVKDELEGYLACGVLARGFATMQSENAECRQKKLVALGCKGRGFCPSCMGRRMAEPQPIWWITSCRACRSGNSCSPCRSSFALPSCHRLRTKRATHVSDNDRGRGSQNLCGFRGARYTRSRGPLPNERAASAIFPRTGETTRKRQRDVNREEAAT